MIDKYLEYLHEYNDPNKPSLYRKVKGSINMMRYRAGLTVDAIKSHGFKKVATNSLSNEEKKKIARRGIDRLYKKGYRSTESDDDYRPAPISKKKKAKALHGQWINKDNELASETEDE